MILKKLHIFSLLLIFLDPSMVLAQNDSDLGLDERINEAFKPIGNWFESVILHDFPLTESIFGTGIPTIIILLVGGALFFTIYFGFVNVI